MQKNKANRRDAAGAMGDCPTSSGWTEVGAGRTSVHALRTELDDNDRRMMAIDHHLNRQNDMSWRGRSKRCGRKNDVDPIAIGVIAASVMLALGIAAWATLKGWQGWLELKRLELVSGRAEATMHPGTGGRIEIADLKERVRKLEAIAAGIDL